MSHCIHHSRSSLSISKLSVVCCEVTYPSETYFKPVRNFAHNAAVSTPYSVQNFETIWQLKCMSWTNEILIYDGFCTDILCHKSLLVFKADNCGQTSCYRTAIISSTDTTSLFNTAICWAWKVFPIGLGEFEITHQCHLFSKTTADARRWLIIVPLSFYLYVL